MIGDIVIVQHPVSVCVPVNHTVTLSVRAEGTAALSYQWFTPDGRGTNKEVPGATGEDLPVRAQRTQLYVCRVHDQFCHCVFSEWVKVKVLDVVKPASGLPGGLWQGEPHIAVNPTPQTVRQGGKLALHCSAFGMPAPRYQWYRNGQPLQGKSTNALQVDCATTDHQGSYLCSVSNVREERWTEPVDVDVVPPDQIPPPTPTATDKVALLIGNLNYSHHPGLMAPTMDVHELANLLQQLGFRVVSLLDLTREEMLAAIEKFIHLLDKGVYGLFYYAGHGYEGSGRNYLVAVDAPQPYRPEDCVCVQRVMVRMQQRQAALSVVLLDTCRKWYNQDCMPSDIMPLEPVGNTVYGYATCEDAEAFEVQDGGKSTGIFTKYLNKHVLQAEKVTHVLEQVSEDLGRDPLVTGKQAVEIKHTLKEPRSLSDPVRTAGHTRELRQRDACWRQANELPRQRRLAFPCGVEVELSFSALFSNVMVAFAVVKTPGPRAQDCTVTLRSTPVMEDIFSGPGCSDDMDSLLFNNSDNANCSLRLCGLQKLQGSLLIEVDLHYTDVDSRLRLKESRQLDVGKPLAASCQLSKRKQGQRQEGALAQRQEGAPAQRREGALAQRQEGEAPTQRREGGAPTQSAGSVPSGRQQAHGGPFTRKAACTSKTTAARSNEPEENDETELQGFLPRRLNMLSLK